MPAYPGCPEKEAIKRVFVYFLCLLSKSAFKALTDPFTIFWMTVWASMGILNVKNLLRVMPKGSVFEDAAESKVAPIKKAN